MDPLPPKQPHRDVTRARRILAGSTDDWQSLVADYSGLALATARRHLSDQDAARNVVVDVFERLYHGMLGQYDGRSSLATWLVLVVRNAAIDQLRREQGRLRVPAAVHRRGDVDQRIFTLFFLQGWPFVHVLSQVRSEGTCLGGDELWDRLHDLYELTDPHVRRRLRYAREAYRYGAPSGRWLEYVDHRRDEMADQQAAMRADANLQAAASEQAMERVRQETSRLDRDEQDVLRLRFHHGLSAREIAHELKLDNQRQAFTLLERSLRKLRRAVVAPPLAGPEPGLEGKS